jgi:hypothetical protein
MKRIRTILGNFISIISCKYTYFICVPIPEGIKINKEYINLNYGDLSPFTNYDLFFYKEGNKLYIWFINEDYIQSSSYLLIPESFLYALSLKRTYKDNIIVLKSKKKNIYCIFILEDGKIVDILIPNQDNKLNIIQLLEKKFQNLKVKEIDISEIKLWTFENIFYTIKVLSQNIRLKNKRFILEKTLSLIIIILTALILSKLSLLILINKEINEKKTIINKLYQKTYLVASDYFFIEKEANVWNNLNSKLSLEKFVILLSKICQVLNKHNAKLKSISANQESIVLDIIAENPSFIKEFNNIKISRKIQILSSQPFGNKNKYKILLQTSTDNSQI